MVRGATPADAPVDEPSTCEPARKRTSAMALGLAVPQSVLLRVDGLST